MAEAPTILIGDFGGGMDLDTITKLRDEDIYPSLFGKMGRGTFPLREEVFAPFGVMEVDPRWLRVGVTEFQPSDDRASWVYVTTGYSDPWEVAPEDYDPEGESGNGVEFVMETPERADWAVMRLQSLVAFDILAAAGRLGDAEPLAYLDQLPLQHPIDGGETSELKTMVICPPEGLAKGFALPSGKVALAQAVGLTNAEAAQAAEFGLATIADKLRPLGAYPVTVPERDSVA